MCFRARQHKRLFAPVMKDFGWLCWPMTSGDGWGLSFPDVCLIIEGNPRTNPQPWKLTRSGIEPRPARRGTTLYYPSSTAVFSLMSHRCFLSYDFFFLEIGTYFQNLSPRKILSTWSGAKGDWDFRISDLSKTLMDLIFKLCDEFRWSAEDPVSQIHSLHLHVGAPGIF